MTRDYLGGGDLFNQSRFNLTRFNVTFSDFIMLSANLIGESRGLARLTGEFNLSTEIQGISDLQTTIIRQVLFDHTFDGRGDLDESFVRQRLFDSDFKGYSELIADYRQFQVKQIEFTGDFENGDRIEINMENFTVTINGQNALKHIEGDFFNLTPGDNRLVFGDSAGNRQVQMTVRKNDRWY